MHQLESYSLHSGLKIGKMDLQDQFFPLPFSEKYVLISSGSGVKANTYAWYRLVVDFLRPVLEVAGYKIVQCGDKDDYRVGADIDVCGRTSLAQYFWLVKHSSLVICNDTSLLHIAGHYDKKIVSSFGISHPCTSRAYFGNPENQIYVLPPAPWTPSYDTNENPKNIDRIYPEKIILAVNKLLNLDARVPETLYIGADYNFHILESIPDSIIRPDFFTGHPLNLRLDKGGDENLMFQQVRIRKSTIITNKPISIEALMALRQNIESVVYVIDKNESDAFATELLRNAIPHTLLSFLPEEELSDIRLKYMDLAFIDRRERFKKLEIDIADAHFKTNKRIFSKGKAYLSYAHLTAGKALDNFAKNEEDVIDTSEFWEDSGFHYIFKYAE